MVECFAKENCKLFKFELEGDFELIEPEYCHPNDEIKPQRMVCYWQDFIMLNRGQKIYYFNARELIEGAKF